MDTSDQTDPPYNALENAIQELLQRIEALESTNPGDPTLAAMRSHAMRLTELLDERRGR